MRHRGFEMWVVYNRPADFPEDFVARRWVGTEPTSQIFVGPTLGVVRGALRTHDPDLVRFTRSEHDEPQIVEVWL